MRPLVFALILCGCASQSKEAPAPAATTVASSMPSNTAPQRPSTPEAGKQAAPQALPPANGGAPASPKGPMTAAEAAALQRGAAGDAATSDEGPCASDADCTFTNVAAGECCPMLCTPRAVTKKTADAAQARMSSCNNGKACPMPQCAPPRSVTVPACEQNRCVSRVVQNAQ